MRAVVLNTNVALETGVGSLADADGSALVIHAGADDYMSQPTGAAGSRLACAVIRPPAAS
jgi:superoxide dismutase, Cu-Zn family